MESIDYFKSHSKAQSKTKTKIRSKSKANSHSKSISSACHRVPHTPFPHQSEAVTAICAALKTAPRTHVVMACGTGKTHVCLWVAEKMKTKRIVVFVPTLALISQILQEWLHDTKWKHVSCLAVCSDETVTAGADTFVLNPEECDFPVTTKAVAIRRFLKEEN